jgi:V8-like Glu-specific endopeptidase
LAQPQFSLQDNILLDYDQRVLHYRSPTEAGSSGSPVFDNNWRLIGLHHSGGIRMPQLNNAGGTYAANEGITFDAIRRGLATQPPEAPKLP